MLFKFLSNKFYSLLKFAVALALVGSLIMTWTKEGWGGATIFVLITNVSAGIIMFADTIVVNLVLGRLKSEIDRLSGENKRYSDLNDDMRVKIDELEMIKRDLTLETESLQSTADQYSTVLKENKSLLKRREVKLDELTTQLETSKHLLEANKTILTARSEELKKQQTANKKLMVIQQQSQALLNELMVAGDEFKSFSTVLSETTDRNMSLADKMHLLVKDMASAKFKELDKDGDGIVTHDEFHSFINK